jgi:uncharacterized protein (TIGR03435 family)
MWAATLILWASSSSTAPTEARSQAALASPAVFPLDPDMAAAMEDQLGLRLERRRIPVEILVVDRAEPPAEN